MWVWSDELVERVSAEGVDKRERVPLVAYAVGPDADLEELANEVLGRVRGDAAVPRPACRGTEDR